MLRHGVIASLELITFLCSTHAIVLTKSLWYRVPMLNAYTNNFIDYKSVGNEHKSRITIAQRLAKKIGGKVMCFANANQRRDPLSS